MPRLRHDSLRVALVLSVLALSSASNGCAAFITSQTFTPITLEEWLESRFSPELRLPQHAWTWTR